MLFIGLFGPFKVGEISIRYSWTTGMKNSWEILSDKKTRFQCCLKLKNFLIYEILGLPILESIISDFLLFLWPKNTNENAPTLNDPNKSKTTFKPLRMNVWMF